MPVLVVHTTETKPGTAQAVARILLRDGKAPHQVYDPSDGTVVHCHDWHMSGAALKNLAGGVETNRRGGVKQVEIVGYAAEVPFYGASWYENLGRYLNRVCDQTGTPKTFPYPFVPGGYGTGAPQRLSNQQWLAVEGIVGHQHVPENSHWDPGGLDVARLLPYLEGDDDVTPQELLDAQIHGDGPLAAVLSWTLQRTTSVAELAIEMNKRLAALEARPAPPSAADIAAAVKAAAPAGPGGAVDLAALAEAVADKLAARLAD